MDEDDLLMSDEAIWRAAEESEREEAWRLFVGILAIEIEEASDRMAAIVGLAREFPSLDDADGIEPWDPVRLDRWMLSEEPCSRSGFWSGMLVLCVWKGKPGAAEYEHVWTGWDREHRQIAKRLAAFRLISLV